MPYTENELLESLVVRRRVEELQENPIKGSYDVNHLKETHRYIFQDLPKVGLWEYDAQPGEFREPSGTWCKDRALHSLRGENGEFPDISFTSYSRMDSKAIDKLNAVLEGAKPENFKGLDKRAFIEKISALYSDLDYLHPFREGNSRTLRVFSEQLAREAGYKLNWKKFNNPDLRDALYIARDRGLAERARQDEDHHPPFVAQALYDMDRHRHFPDLARLLENTVERIEAGSSKEEQDGHDVER